MNCTADKRCTSRVYSKGLPVTVKLGQAQSMTGPVRRGRWRRQLRAPPAFTVLPEFAPRVQSERGT